MDLQLQTWQNEIVKSHKIRFCIQYSSHYTWIDMLPRLVKDNTGLIPGIQKREAPPNVKNCGRIKSPLFTFVIYSWQKKPNLFHQKWTPRGVTLIIAEEHSTQQSVKQVAEMPLSITIATPDWCLCKKAEGISKVVLLSKSFNSHRETVLHACTRCSYHLSEGNSSIHWQERTLQNLTGTESPRVFTMERHRS